MGKLLESRANQKQPVTAETLLAPGGIESLIGSGRIPGVLKYSTGAWAVVPPEGREDHVRKNSLALFLASSNRRGCMDNFFF